MIVEKRVAATPARKKSTRPAAKEGLITSRMMSKLRRTPLAIIVAVWRFPTPSAASPNAPTRGGVGQLQYKPALGDVLHPHANIGKDQAPQKKAKLRCWSAAKRVGRLSEACMLISRLV